MNNRWKAEDLNEKIAKKIGEAALLEQTAEECAELSKEVLKLARILRGDNPTPKSKAWVLQDVIEEIADVSLCLDVLKEALGCYKSVDEIKEEKCNRWIERIEKKEKMK